MKNSQNVKKFFHGCRQKSVEKEFLWGMQAVMAQMAMTGKALWKDAGCDGPDSDDRKTVLQRKGKNVRMNKLTTESNGPDGMGEFPF